MSVSLSFSIFPVGIVLAISEDLIWVLGGVVQGPQWDPGSQHQAKWLSGQSVSLAVWMTLIKSPPS